MAHQRVRAGRVSFELELLEVDGDRCEIRGRWFGIRGRRFMRPALTIFVGSEQTRLLADLAGKPWAAEDGESWSAAFPYPDDAGTLIRAELTVAPDITVTVAGAEPGTGAAPVRTTGRPAAPKQPERAAELARALEERNRHVAESVRAAEERDRAAVERDRAAAERDRLASELVRMTAEQERLAADRRQAEAEAELLAATQERLAAAHDRLREERDQIAAATDAEQAHREAERADLAQLQRQTAAERDAAIAERDRALAQLQRVEASYTAQAASAGAAMVMHRAGRDAVSRHRLLSPIGAATAIMFAVVIALVVLIVLRYA